MRPVILVGVGCKNNPGLIDYLGSLGIPILTTWMAIDFYDENHPSFCGRPGIYGQRAANIIQQKADVLVCLGARLDNEQVAYSYENFAPKAHKIIFDIDKAELNKFPNDWEKVHENLSIECPELSYMLEPNKEWLKWCKDLYKRFRPELDGQYKAGYDSPQWFINALSEHCEPSDVLAIGSSGGAALSFVQCFKIKKGQRVTNLSTIGAMGADIPMAIGACIASGKRRTVCVTGDGGVMLNVQELEVVTQYQLPIKFFVYNNNGYGSIRSMQDARFAGHHVGCDPESGMTLPSIEAIANAFQIPHYCYDSCAITSGFDRAGPMICELYIDPNHKQLPRVSSYMDDAGKFHWMSMENMQPELDKDEFEKIMKY